MTASFDHLTGDVRGAAGPSGLQLVPGVLHTYYSPQAVLLLLLWCLLCGAVVLALCCSHRLWVPWTLPLPLVGALNNGCSDCLVLGVTTG